MTRPRLTLHLLLPTLAGLAGGSSASQVPDFTKDVWPILERRCLECHGPEKHKADLRLDLREGLFEGDEGWIPVVPGKVEESYLLERVSLPAEDPDRMPPKGDPLAPDEIELLKRWVREGAPWSEPPARARESHPETLSLPPLTPEDLARVAAARAALEAKGGRSLRVAQDTEATEVNLSLLGEDASSEHVALLEGLAPVLVHLNLARTQVGDEDLARIGMLRELRHLDLSRTKVSDAGLTHLGELHELRYLNLYGTAISDAGLQSISGLGRLRRLFLWQTAVTDEGVERLEGALPGLEIVRGAEPVPPAEPRASNETCPVSGQAVDVAVFSEVDGQRIAFCCGMCKKVFDADPAPYLEKLRATAINATCPVSGKPVDAAFISELDGKRVAFCCASCKAQFEADPEALREKIEGL